MVLAQRPAGAFSFSELFGERVAALGGARQAKERGARPRLSCEQLLERAQLVGTRAADDRLERLVGVDGFALRGRDHHPCIESVRGRRHDLGHGHPLAKAQVPGREREQEEEPHGREHGHCRQEQGQAGTARNEGEHDRARRRGRGDRRENAAHSRHRIERIKGSGLQLDCVALTHAQGG
jgi:hypothetical protein